MARNRNKPRMAKAASSLLSTTRLERYSPSDPQAVPTSVPETLSICFSNMDPTRCAGWANMVCSGRKKVETPKTRMTSGKTAMVMAAVSASPYFTRRCQRLSCWRRAHALAGNSRTAFSAAIAGRGPSPSGRRLRFGQLRAVQCLE